MNVVYVIYDMTCLYRIVVVLNQWIRALGDKAFDTFPTLTKSLKLIFGHPPSPQACQVTVCVCLCVCERERERERERVSESLCVGCVHAYV